MHFGFLIFYFFLKVYGQWRFYCILVRWFFLWRRRILIFSIMAKQIYLNYLWKLLRVCQFIGVKPMLWNFLVRNIIGRPIYWTLFFVLFNDFKLGVQLIFFKDIIWVSWKETVCWWVSEIMSQNLIFINLYVLTMGTLFSFNIITAWWIFATLSRENNNIGILIIALYSSSPHFNLLCIIVLVLLCWWLVFGVNVFGLPFCQLLINHISDLAECHKSIIVLSISLLMIKITGKS